MAHDEEPLLEYDHPHVASTWYREAIFYSVDLARFRDSDADGYGDFKGLTHTLDYLSWLGIDAIWLQPFYRSPRRDNGYDITDHYEIDLRLGHDRRLRRLPARGRAAQHPRHHRPRHQPHLERASLVPLVAQRLGVPAAGLVRVGG
jgi:hypothetical protein